MTLRKHQRFWWIMVAVAIGGSVTGLLLSQREPKIGGKRISTLLAEMSDGDFASDAEDLVRAAGVEAIPPLINALDRTNSPHRDAYNSLRAKMPNFLLPLMPESKDKAIFRANAAN